jgi:hypothetical protein
MESIVWITVSVHIWSVLVPSAQFCCAPLRYRISYAVSPSSPSKMGCRATNTSRAPGAGSDAGGTSDGAAPGASGSASGGCDRRRGQRRTLS